MDDPHTHDIKGQHEIRDGDKVIGNYWFIQPDGRKRTVKYSSDHKSGFVLFQLFQTTDLVNKLYIYVMLSFLVFNSFHAEVNYQPIDGHHYEVNEHHNHENHNNWEHGRRHIGEGRGDRRDGDHDRRRSLGIDDRRHDNQDDRRQDGRGDRREHDDNRDDDDKRNHDDKRDHRDNSWGWLRSRQQHDHREGRKDDIGGRRLGYEEHWKGGVLVGWREGSDRDSNHRGRDDRHNDWDHNRGNDKQNDDRHDDRRGQRLYHVPLTNFKPLVPYGQRLH